MDSKTRKNKDTKHNIFGQGLVPRSPASRINNRYVFLNDNGVAKRVDVTLGDRFDDQIEIISDGIKENDELVVVGQAKLVDGRKLNVQK